MTIFAFRVLLSYHSIGFHLSRGGGVHRILLLPLMAKCLETIDVYMAHACFYACCTDCVCCVAAVVKVSVNSRFLGLVSVWAARSFDQTALRPSVIKRIRQN